MFHIVKITSFGNEIANRNIDARKIAWMTFSKGMSIHDPLAKRYSKRILNFSPKPKTEAFRTIIYLKLNRIFNFGTSVVLG